MSLKSNACDGQMTNFTPFSSDQMRRNLNIKIGEVDLGIVRLLCVASQRSQLSHNMVVHIKISNHFISSICFMDMYKVANLSHFLLPR